MDVILSLFGQVIDVKPRELGIPTEAYVALQETKDDGSALLTPTPTL